MSLDKIKSSFTKLLDYFRSSKDETTEPEEKTEVATQVKTQVNYFGVDPKTQRFVRRYAPFVSLSAHALKVRIDGEEWEIPSHWDLTRLKFGQEPYLVIAAFAYAREGETEQLYRLPEGRVIFDEGTDLVVPLISREVHDRTLFQDNRFLSAQKLFNDTKASFTRARDAVLSLLQNQAQFVQQQVIPSLPDMMPGTPQGVAAVASSNPVAVKGAVTNQRDVLKLLPREDQKKFRRGEKDRRRIAKDLMRPE